jgi:hypothetical protein
MQHHSQIAVSFGNVGQESNQDLPFLYCCFEITLLLGFARAFQMHTDHILIRLGGA